MTVVPVDAWGRPLDARHIRKIDQQRLAAQRTTLDPLSLTPLRNAALHSAWGRGKIDLPPGIAKKLRDTPVYLGAEVRQSKFRKDLPKSMRVERVSDTARNEKFKIKDQRQESQQADMGRKPEVDKAGKQDMGRVNAEARKETRETQQQARKLEQQQRKETRTQEKATGAQLPAPEKAQQKAQRKAQGERVAKPAKPESKPQSQGAQKQEHKQKPASAPPEAKGNGGGKGKGKKP